MSYVRVDRTDSGEIAIDASEGLSGPEVLDILMDAVVLAHANANAVDQDGLYVWASGKPPADPENPPE